MSRRDDGSQGRKGLGDNAAVGIVSTDQTAQQSNGTLCHLQFALYGLNQIIQLLGAPGQNCLGLPVSQGGLLQGCLLYTSPSPRDS